MGSRRFPPLTPAEVVAIVLALGFSFKKQTGSHAHYERPAEKPRPRAVVTVDMSVRTFSVDLMQSMVRQSKSSRGEFYGATERTRKKI